MHVVMAIGRRRTNAMMNRCVCRVEGGCVTEESQVQGRKLREEVAGLKTVTRALEVSAKGHGNV